MRERERERERRDVSPGSAAAAWPAGQFHSFHFFGDPISGIDFCLFLSVDEQKTRAQVTATQSSNETTTCSFPESPDAVKKKQKQDRK